MAPSSFLLYLRLRHLPRDRLQNTQSNAETAYRDSPASLACWAPTEMIEPPRDCDAAADLLMGRSAGVRARRRDGDAVPLKAARTSADL
jgi:hypothetical protein